LICRWA